LILARKVSRPAVKGNREQGPAAFGFLLVSRDHRMVIGKDRFGRGWAEHAGTTVMNGDTITTRRERSGANRRPREIQVCT
jgi:hypothetical protein